MDESEVEELLNQPLNLPTRPDRGRLMIDA
jgi:hypothetical protein